MLFLWYWSHFWNQVPFLYYFSIRKENRFLDSLPFIFELFQRVIDTRNPQWRSGYWSCHPLRPLPSACRMLFTDHLCVQKDQLRPAGPLWNIMSDSKSYLSAWRILLRLKSYKKKERYIPASSNKKRITGSICPNSFNIGGKPCVSVPCDVLILSHPVDTEFYRAKSVLAKNCSRSLHIAMALHTETNKTHR